MVAQRQSRGNLQRQGVPIRAQLEGPRVNEPRATYTSTTAAPPRPRRSSTRQSRNSGRRSNRISADPRTYSPTRAADKSSAGVGLLEAEFFGIIFLLTVSLFFGTDSYGDKIMSFMKRGMLTAILFFFLALIAGVGSNAAKISKAIGAMVFVAILISTPGQDVVTSLDNFFKQAWVGTDESGQSASSSSPTASGGTTGVIGKIENAASSAANSITEIQLPGIGPVFALDKLATALKGLFHL